MIIFRHFSNILIKSNFQSFNFCIWHKVGVVLSLSPIYKFNISNLKQKYFSSAYEGPMQIIAIGRKTKNIIKYKIHFNLH